MTSRAQLVAASSLRVDELTIGELTLTVQEPDALTFGQYGELAKEGDRNAANAFIIRHCVILEDGGLDEEGAAAVAKSTRLCVPIMAKIMELSGFGKEEKEKQSDAG